MPSPHLPIGRRSIHGAYYLLTTTVIHRQPLFTDGDLVDCVVEALRCSDREHRSRTLAWVVMPDQMHWLIQLGNGNISRCVQAFKSRSSRAINLHRGTPGVVWQRAFDDRCIRADESLLEQANALMEIPVRAGLAPRVGNYPYCWTRWPAGCEHPTLVEAAK